jgi:hypothetical protein
MVGLGDSLGITSVPGLAPTFVCRFRNRWWLKKMLSDVLVFDSAGMNDT